MKIGFFGTRMDLISGHSRPAFELAGELNARGHQVRIFSSRLSPQREAYHQSLSSAESFQIVRPFNTYRDLLRPRDDLKAFIASCDIIHEFSPYGLGLFPALNIRSVPSVISITNNLRVSLSDYMRSGTVSLRHGVQLRYLLNLTLPRFILKTWLNRAQAIVSWTQFTYRQTLKLGISTERLVHIPVGIDHTRFSVDPISDKPGAPTFAFIGPVAPIRGVDLLLEAFAQYQQEVPSSHLLIADRGPDLPEERSWHSDYARKCREIISRAGLEERVTWQGFTPDISSLLNAADVLVLPFRGALGYSQPPLIMLEALIHGKPVIGTVTGGIPETIQTGTNGILIPPDDKQALLKAMHQAISLPFQHTGQEIQRQCIRQHAWPSIVDAHEAVYHRVLAEMVT